MKICQHMYDAAEADLRKAVEDEQRAAESLNGTSTTTVGRGDRTDVGAGTSAAASARANGVGSTSSKAGVDTDGHSANGVTSANGSTHVNGSMSNGNTSATGNMSTNGGMSAGGSIVVNGSLSNGNTSADENMRSNGDISGENKGGGYKGNVEGEDDAKIRKVEGSDDAGNCESAGGVKEAGLVDVVRTGTEPEVGVAAAADGSDVSSTGRDRSDGHSNSNNPSDSSSSSGQTQQRAEKGHQHLQSKPCEKGDQSAAIPAPAPAPTSTVPLTEAGRWLARVRAKIAQMDQARTVAANQASQRAEIMAAMQKQAAESARVRARHGPGHVPRRRSPSPRASTATGTAVGREAVEVVTDGASAGAADEKLSGVVGDGGVGDSSGERSAGGGVNGESGEGAVVWRVPRPPKLHNPKRTPAMVMNDYAMYSRFQVRRRCGVWWMRWVVCCRCSNEQFSTGAHALSHQSDWEVVSGFEQSHGSRCNTALLHFSLCARTRSFCPVSPRHLFFLAVITRFFLSSFFLFGRHHARLSLSTSKSPEMTARWSTYAHIL